MRIDARAQSMLSPAGILLQPSVPFIKEKDFELFAVYATRDINEGDELQANYRSDEDIWQIRGDASEE